MQASPSVLVEAFLPPTADQSRVNRVALDIALVVGFAWFVALCAQVAVRLPWTTVPITGQTFAVLVTGGALGARRGAASLAVYMLMGIIGLPVFAPAAGSLGLQGEWAAHFVLPWKGLAADPWNMSSGGYIVGFVLAAFVAGHFAQRSWDRKPWAVVAMLAANAAVYVPGLLWLYYLISSGWVPPGASQSIGEFIAGSSAWDKALKGGLYPFIVGDLMKLYLAAVTLPAAWALLERLKGGRGSHN